MSRRRAYIPAQSTFDLRDRVLALPWVDNVEIEAPHHGTTVTHARFWVTDLDGRRQPMSFARARLATGPEPHRCRARTQANGAQCGRFIRSNRQHCWEHDR